MVSLLFSIVSSSKLGPSCNMPTSYHERGAKYCKAKAFRNNALSIIITASLPSTKRKSTIVNGYLVSLVYFVYHCVKKQEASHWQCPLSQWRKMCARSFINTSYTSSDVSFIISSTFLQTKSIFGNPLIEVLPIFIDISISLRAWLP